MRILSLLIFFALVGAAAVCGGRFLPGEWYQQLSKPTWTPPDWVFPVVWTILYVLIAIAGWLVSRRQGAGLALALWFIGLGLNALWSYLMFGRHEIGWALADVVALWLSIAGFIASSWHVDRTASYLFMPYLAWVSLATALNAAVWQMNPQQMP